MRMKCKDWKIPYSRPEVPEELLSAGYNPLLSAVLALRGVHTADDADRLIHGSVDCLYDPMLIMGMRKARERVLAAIERKEKVAVYGDYDVDGITATCLLTDYLRSRGLECIPYIPDRNEEGYGLNTSALDSLKSEGVSLVITVDCGITAAEETRYARSIGIDMVITDHHECKEDSLPDAAAVVDCKQCGDTYPNKDMAGVGVALKLVCACDDNTLEILRRYVDLVAVGTVADVMPLVGENRYLVREGIKKLIDDPRPGIAAMLHESSIDRERLTASTIGYSLAPRLNAAGRLGHAVRAAELIMTENNLTAATLAAELCELNRQRQNIETSIWKEANELISDDVPDGPIVLASDSWHQGVIGIAASRLAEQYSLPAIMICLNGDMGKGSCRSYGGFNLFEALSACSDHLVGFGGHALAAGLNIKADKLDDFRTALTEYYRKNRPAPQPEVQCDMLITDPLLLSRENVCSLDMLEPFGNGNPKPLMCICGAELTSATAVGKGRHLRIRIKLRGCSFEGIFFGHTSDELGVRVGHSVDIAFTPQINEYNGSVTVQLLVSALRRHESYELCRAILDGDRSIYWAASQYCPDRKDFVYLWRNVCRGSFTVPMRAEDVIASCPAGFEAERYCLCLMVLMEAGLLASDDGRIYGAGCVHIQGKADLEATSLIRALRAFEC